MVAMARTRFREGKRSRAAAERLVEEHFGLVKRCLNDWAKRRPENINRHRGDLHSEGVFALWRAAMLFDSEKRTRFENYATQRIKGAFTDYCRKWMPMGFKRSWQRKDAESPRVVNMDAELMARRPLPVSHARLLDLEQAEQARLVLAALGPRQRECFVLHHGQGFHPKVIGEMLGLAPDTVWVTLFHAQKKLSKILSDRGASYAATRGCRR